LETQGFLYKQLAEAYLKDKPSLDGLGAISHERWNLMRRIHFILPNMTDKGQAATPKMANVPHYQSSLSQIRSQVGAFLRQGGGIVSFKICQPDRDYSNHFLHVTNSGVPGILKIDWDGLAKLAHNGAKGEKKRQHKYKDFGTTGGQCTTRVGSAVGVSKANKKPGTNDACIVEAMLALSQFTKESAFLWIPDGLRPFNCDIPDDPQKKIAKRFHPDCIIQAVQVGLTNSKHPCSYHCDEMNSNRVAIIATK
jgi:hypothetical protein